MRTLALAVIMATVAACSGGGGRATSSSATLSTSTTNPAGIPLRPTVDSLSWTGTVAVTSTEGGVSAQLDAEVSGSFVAPREHRVAVSATSTTGDETEVVEWEATIVGARGWVLEAGDLRGFGSEGVADEYMTVLGTATGCVIPSAGLLADLAGTQAAGYEDRGGRRTAVFEIVDAPVVSYAPLFASDFALAFGASVQFADVTLAVDTATGLVVEGELRASGDGLDVEVTFTVTAFDDPEIVIAEEDLTVPDAGDLVSYVDPAGEFSAVYPREWDVDEFEGGTTFAPPFTAVEAYASVVVIPGSTIDEVIDGVLSDASPATEILERDSVESGGLDYEKLTVRFREGERALTGSLWLTVAGGTGYGFQFVVEEREFDRFTPLAEAMFAGFEPVSGGSSS
jgi:hypothetical protein